jgi:NAD(P)-dependent dehydrogenase (short-subunit alcohol dehydrogenase family)
MMIGYIECIMSNRVALITGSSRGIGRATALALSQAGFDIVVASFEVEKNEEVAGEIRAAGGNAITLDLNLTSQESVKTGFASVLKGRRTRFPATSRTLVPFSRPSSGSRTGWATSTSW